MRLPVVVLTVLLQLPSSAFAVLIAYNFTGPIDSNGVPVPTNTIVGFDLSNTIFATALGPNGNPKPPVLAGRVPGTEFVPGQKIVLPNTRDGVDPVKGDNPRFDFNDVTLFLGPDQFDPRKRAGVPNGITFRKDQSFLSWTRRAQAFEFGRGYQLSFGAQINADNKLYREQFSLVDAFWTFDNKSSVGAGQNAVNTIKMGQNLPSPDDEGRNGLSFSYTNDSGATVVLSELHFETRRDELPLELLNPGLSTLGGTILFDPVVTLDDSPVSNALSFLLPAHSTLEFLFPATADPFFTAHGFVSDLDGTRVLEFAFEIQLASEPAAWMLIAAAMFVFFYSTCSRNARRTSDAPVRLGSIVCVNHDGSPLRKCA